MYHAKVRTHFDAAHFLRGYQGKCERLHGHRFIVEVMIETETLNEIGLSVDFGILKKYLKEIAGRLDHINLNDIPPFDELNPSSENLARYFFLEMKAKLSDARLKQVTVWESPDACASYLEDCNITDSLKIDTTHDSIEKVARIIHDGVKS